MYNMVLEFYCLRIEILEVFCIIVFLRQYIRTSLDIHAPKLYQQGLH